VCRKQPLLKRNLVQKTLAAIARLEPELVMSTVEHILRDDPASILVKSSASYVCSLNEVGGPHLKGNAGSQPDVPWKPLGQVGCHDVDMADIWQAYDPLRPFKCPRGTLAPKLVHPSSAASDMIDDLIGMKCTDEVDPDTEISMSVRVALKPGGRKCLLIADCRGLIASEVIAPTKFVLPNLCELWVRFPCVPPELGVGPVAFCKVDVQNAYWSVRLPLKVASRFCFGLGSRRFILLRLPFGWDKSPSTFQSVIQGLVCVFLKLGMIVILIYLDDFLLAGRDLVWLEEVTVDFVQCLELNGFVVSYQKTVMKPTFEIEWLGKCLKSDDEGITITTPVSDVVACFVLLIWCCCKVSLISCDLMRRFTGLVSWCSCRG